MYVGKPKFNTGDAKLMAYGQISLQLQYFPKSAPNEVKQTCCFSAADTPVPLMRLTFTLHFSGTKPLHSILFCTESTRKKQSTRDEITLYS